LIAPQVVPQKAHTPVKDAAVAATCHQEGKTEGSHCLDCNTVLTAQTTLPKKAHTPVSYTDVKATCQSHGYRGGSYCSVCRDVLEAPETLPKTDHSFGQWQTVQSATNTVNGIKKRTCNDCGHEESASIPAPNGPIHVSVVLDHCDSGINLWDDITATAYKQNDGYTVSFQPIVSSMKYDKVKYVVTLNGETKTAYKVFDDYDIVKIIFKNLPAGDYVAHISIHGV
jgi:hypothetical protein